MNGARTRGDGFAPVDALVSAAARLRPADIRDVLDTAADALGQVRCIDTVLMPAIRLIGQRAGAETDPPMSVSLAVETARAWLESLTAHAPLPDSGRPILLACGPGDRHSLGVEALTMLMRYRRQPCRLLGARLSVSRVVIAVEVNDPAGVILVAERESGRRSCVELLTTLSTTRATAFYAGAAFDPMLARRDVAGIYLGTSFERACSTITRTLAANSAAARLSSE